MKPWLLLIIACGLVGCGRGDPDICVPIPNVAEPSDTLPAHRDVSTARRLAEACLHREAYRLARSVKSVELTTREAMRRCSFLVDGFSGRFAAARNPPGKIDEHFNLVVHPRLLGQARNDLWRFAEGKVREGRAGKCRV